MQNITAPAVFNPRAFYDGKKNLFSVGPLRMEGDAAEVKKPRASGLDMMGCSRLRNAFSSWSACPTLHSPLGVLVVSFA